MISSVYSVIKTKDLEETSKFYEKYFGFERSFSSDWYISLKSGNCELAILDSEHGTIPERFRGITNPDDMSQTLINFETEEVDAIYESLVNDGHEMFLEIRDEDWGQRHFITQDPNGQPLDVIKNIPPSPEFLAQYS
jgi:uncharacterized glyoxalase superfamily protein PhnB